MQSPTTAATRTEGVRPGRARPRAAQRGRARWHWSWALWLSLALVLAQGLGSAHRTAHGLLHHEWHPVLRMGTIAAAEPVASAWRQLFGEHGSDAQCLLYDQMSHGDCAPMAAFSLLPAAAPALPAPAVARTAPRRTRIAVRARGPPAAA